MALLVAAHVALPLAAFGFSLARPDDWGARNVFRVVLFSEAGLLAVWAALSQTAWPRRAALAALGWTFCWILLALRHPTQSAVWLSVYLLLPSCATLVLALAVRTSKRRRAEKQGAAPAEARWQFTTSDLLTFTTVIGVAIVFVQRFLASRLSIEPLFLLCEGSQLALLVVLGLAAGQAPRRRPGARDVPRIVAAAVVACGLGLVMQSYLSASWFWDALRSFRGMAEGNFPGAAVGVLWEDLFSIPITVLIESLFGVATVWTWRNDRGSAERAVSGAHMDETVC